MSDICPDRESVLREAMARHDELDDVDSLIMAHVFELGIFQPRMDANARESWNVIRVH